MKWSPILNVVGWSLLFLWLARKAWSLAHGWRLARTGNRAVATVTYASGTGARTNGVPSLLITLEYAAADGTYHRRNFTQTFDIGGQPRQGDRMAIHVNPNDPSDFTLASKRPL